MLKLILAAALASLLSACGTLTGIPSHGGGKRFAVEQELVAASARAAVKDLSLSALQGHRVALYVSVMGDQGSGIMTGGRYSVDALIRGEYLNNPPATTDYNYPGYDTTSGTKSGAISSITTVTGLLNSPSHTHSQSKGGAAKQSVGVAMNGQGDYRNETLISNPRDTTFLSNLIQTLFFLRGIDVVPPEYADTDVFITVDVFGTIRSRTELHLYNAETLRAVTKMEYFAVERENHTLLIKPATTSWEASYREKYALWMGPLKTEKRIKPSAGLLVSFAGITPYGNGASSETAPQWQQSSDNQPLNEPVIRKYQQRKQP